MTSYVPAWAWQFSPGHLAGAQAMNLPAPLTPSWAWGGATGKGVKVAVIDSGVDATHPFVGEVAGGVVVEAAEGSPDGVRITTGPHDDLFGHGTACAGIIRKAAPECDIYSVRVLGSKLTGRGVVFAAGLRWAIDAGMDVVNLSLSTGLGRFFGRFHELADAAYFRNTVLVCAVNNVPAPSYPSQFASVVSVAAHEGTDPFAISYNPNPPVEFGAPGVDLEVAWLNGRTVTATGNSFACPHVAGLVARLLSKHPELTPFQVKTVLHAVATNVASE
ncbi:MAG: S8 family serine peptidase [Actinomycetes bacterium]